MNKKLLCGMACLSLAAFFGCAAEDNGSGSTNSAGDTSEKTPSEVESIYELGKCTSATKGDTVYVEDEDADYVCNGKTWKIIEADRDSDDDDDEVDDEKSCSSSAKRSSASKSDGVASSNSGDDDVIPGEDPESPSSSSRKSSSSSKRTSLDDDDSSDDDEVSSSASKSDAASSNSGGTSTNVVEVAESLEDAEECTESNMGHLVYVQSEGTKYACTSLGYVAIAAESSSAKASSSSSEKATANSSSAKAPASSATGTTVVGESKITDIRDGRTYSLVTIGTLSWMKENLNYAPSSTADSWCYDDDSENCDVLGRLYSWSAAKSVCPEGMRLPTYNDWLNTRNFISSRRMSYFGFTTTKSGRYQSVTDDEYVKGFVNGAGTPGAAMELWTSTKKDEGVAYALKFTEVEDSYGTSMTGNGLAVRCVRDVVEACNESSYGTLVQTSTALLSCDYMDGEYAWREGDKLEYNTYGMECEEGKITTGLLDSYYYVTCYHGAWREATEVEYNTYGLSCVEGKVVQGKVNTSSYFTCEDGAWRKATTIESDTYGLSCVDGSIVTGKDTGKTYYCNAGEWIETPFILELWDAAALVAEDKSFQVQTGDKTGGHWYYFTDVGNMGLSTLTWGAEVGDEYDERSLYPVIKACGGLCGTYDLKVGGNKYKPFVGFAFGYGRASNTTGDGTAMGGICVEYRSDDPIKVELGLTPAVENSIGYTNHFATIPAATTASVANLKWTDFAQPTWVSSSQTLATATAVKQLSSIKFKIEGPEDGKDGNSGSFLITKVGPLGACN